MKNVINDSTIVEIYQQKHCCSDIHTVEYLRQMYAERADPLCATVLNDLHIDPLMPPTAEPSRGRRMKNRIESQSIVVPKCGKPRL